KIVEQTFRKSIKQLQRKSPEEILELIKAFNKKKHSLSARLTSDYGLNNEFDPLKSVLVHRPGPEVELVDEKNPWKWLFNKKYDLHKALLEYDDMIRLIRQETGANVIFLQDPDKESNIIYPPNQSYVRDHGFMTPYGAIIGHSDQPRTYEEDFVMRKLIELDIPIIFKVYGSGIVEGGDVIYLDEETLLLGLSYRTNLTGYRQVKAVMEGFIVDRVIPVRLAPEVMHLDTVFNVASRTVAAVYPKAVPKRFIKTIKRKGFEIVEVPKREAKTLAVNWLCLAPEKILFIDGEEKMNISTRKKLERHGIDIVSLKMPELLGGAGGPRCLTMPLSRK
ncbi:MAG: arginine deiminase family protein, partial [Candidatus Bathyarchaeia archaeon]